MPRGIWMKSYGLFLNQQAQGVLFQQDNATPHKARITMDFLNVNNVPLLPWPARSPDLSPIEHVWDHLGQKLRGRQNVIHNVQDLENALVDEWNRIPENVIRRLTFSMRRRLRACLDARGGHTRY